MNKRDYYNINNAFFKGNTNGLIGISNLICQERTNPFWSNHEGTKVHVPLASDIVTFSSTLLFAETPTVTTGDDVTDARMEEILKMNNINEKLLSAGETCSAFGGVYAKIRWDATNTNVPIVDFINPISGDMIFENDYLTSIVFNTPVGKLSLYGTKEYTLVEVYTRGTIDTYLYSTNDWEQNKLGGSKLPLTTLKETADIQETISTNIDSILAVYIPNTLPSKQDNQKEGRSDLDGLYGLLDTLDEVYSSLIRDVHLGKARIMIPYEYITKKDTPLDDYMETHHISSFDVDKEVYVTMDIDPDKGGIEPHQFDIRSKEHMEVIETIINSIISGANYSPQSFGIGIQGNAQSGTALNIRERQTYITKNKKEVTFKYNLEILFNLMLQVDNSIFTNSNVINTVNLTFEDYAQFDLALTSTIVETLSRAGAISTRSKIIMVHPDWTTEEVDIELEMIQKEQGFNVTDPLGIS